MPFDTMNRPARPAHCIATSRDGAERTPCSRGDRDGLRARGVSTFLPRRGTLILDNREGTVIAVESGCLWITMERDPRDVVLVAGMRFEIDRPGRTVIAAEEDSRFRLREEPSGSLLLAKIRERAAQFFERASASRRSVPYF